MQRTKSGADMTNVTKIDCHQHFWLRERGDYDWLTPALGAIYEDFLPKDLAPLLTQAGVSKTVLVQAAETDAETDFMLDLANQSAFIAGVVGWVDMAAPNALARLEQLKGQPFFKGIRPMIQDIPDDNWMLDASLDPAFRYLIDHGLCFDALVKPQHLDNLYTLLKRYPTLNVVIDHGAKPNIAGDHYNEWAEKLAKIAQDTQAFCKLSGLITEADASQGFSSLEPYADLLLESFGAKRLMWGSDWPVLNLASNYADWANWSQTYIAKLSEGDQQSIWGGAAADFYRL